MGKSPRWASMAMSAKELRKAAWLTLGVVALGAGGLWGMVDALTSGVAHGRGGAIYARATSPIGFWFVVSVCAFVTLLSLACVIQFVRMVGRGVYRPTYAELEEARTAAAPITRRLSGR